MDHQSAVKILAMALSAIEQIVDSARDSKLFDDSKAQAASDALLAIGAIVETVKSGKLEGLDPKEAQEELDLLLAAIGDNDDAVDAAVDAKFDKSEG